MAFQYLAYTLQTAEEREDYSVFINRRALRDIDNPFDLEQEDFRKIYRLSPNLARFLIDNLDCQLRGSRITSISTEKQVRKHEICNYQI